VDDYLIEFGHGVPFKVFSCYVCVMKVIVLGTDIVMHNNILSIQMNETLFWNDTCGCLCLIYNNNTTFAKLQKNKYCTYSIRM
jgi:hypothetical protein